MISSGKYMKYTKFVTSFSPQHRGNTTKLNLMQNGLSDVDLCKNVLFAIKSSLFQVRNTRPTGRQTFCPFNTVGN